MLEVVLIWLSLQRIFGSLQTAGSEEPGFASSFSAPCLEPHFDASGGHPLSQYPRSCWWECFNARPDRTLGAAHPSWEGKRKVRLEEKMSSSPHVTAVPGGRSVKEGQLPFCLSGPGHLIRFSLSLNFRKLFRSKKAGQSLGQLCGVCRVCVHPASLYTES